MTSLSLYLDCIRDFKNERVTQQQMFCPDVRELLDALQKLRARARERHRKALPRYPLYPVVKSNGVPQSSMSQCHRLGLILFSSGQTFSQNLPNYSK